MRVQANTTALRTSTDSRLSDVRAIALIIVGVSLIYGVRLTLEPMVGEETRWATAAREMLRTGDWVVPRQQGEVFPERPPMTMWLMAVGGWFRGDVDAVATRLPSVVATVLTSLLIYGYARAITSSTTALIAALIFPTVGQVLQIGRLGESEAVFTLFLAASLLFWHLGYVRRWRPIVVWVLSFAFAALAALVKGPQAPAYFITIVGSYLIVVRDWRYVVRWQAVAGAATFIAIIAAWQVPFYLATDWSSVHATWAGLAGDRFRLSGVLLHSVSYPFETFICLLPWSPMLIGLAYRDVRTSFHKHRDITTFLYTAILVAYPTVWLAAGARGRYFMPLYPIVAILCGLLIECCSQAATGSMGRRVWNRFLMLWAPLIGVCAVFVGLNSLLPSNIAVNLFQPAWFARFCSILSLLAAGIIWLALRANQTSSPLLAVLAITSVAGIGAAGLMLNINSARWYDPTAAIADIASQVPNGSQLVSLNEIEHRFAYYYGTPIPQIAWPKTVDELPPNVNYFCFMRHWNDSAEAHATGRGRSWRTIAGTLPFEWEEIVAISPDRVPDKRTATSVVLGRVIRPVRAAVSDTSKPQQAIADRSIDGRRTY
jgi:4-amino-4-deoxy-L-arabinose transferase-like glycosyltransferase